MKTIGKEVELLHKREQLGLLILLVADGMSRLLESILSSRIHVRLIQILTYSRSINISPGIPRHIVCPSIFHSHSPLGTEKSETALEGGGTAADKVWDAMYACITRN